MSSTHNLGFFNFCYIFMATLKDHIIITNIDDTKKLFIYNQIIKKKHIGLM